MLKYHNSNTNSIILQSDLLIFNFSHPVIPAILHKNNMYHILGAIVTSINFSVFKKQKS